MLKYTVNIRNNWLGNTWISIDGGTSFVESHYLSFKAFFQLELFKIRLVYIV